MLITQKEATFSNTIEALVYSKEQLDVVSNIFFNLNSSGNQRRNTENKHKKFQDFIRISSQISQNEALFARIKKVFDEKYYSFK